MSNGNVLTEDLYWPRRCNRLLTEADNLRADLAFALWLLAEREYQMLSFIEKVLTAPLESPVSFDG